MASNAPLLPAAVAATAAMLMVLSGRSKKLLEWRPRSRRSRLRRRLPTIRGGQHGIDR